MSNSSAGPLPRPLADGPLTCCVPLAREPMDAAQAVRVVPLLKAIADPARLRLLSLVLSHEGGEACVCDLVPYFDLTQPTISHHLKVLHENGLLDREKRGTWVFYRARPEAMAALGSLFSAGALDAVTDELAGAGA
ncbi:metalloregulator ArsR/SmtB family transcription factor [Nocardioides panaciterrulae]|uniref:ArsR family transcriptional regulator n=1 Tax=Nocardioides panaciterrulae TaxID=661492 RepID=A0A7Y9E8I7_9ACTN|nr:ArsR family transcriptional regulator [Nocardioides panaciterrulae]